ncbi:hypothetical protein CPR18618_PPKEINIP_02801 (plasmid) [Companilactobacillus paralimentarius]
MNASEKAQADLEEQRQALKEQQDRLQEKLDEADRKDALAATKTVLTDKHIPAEFAEFISDVKEDVRNNNLDKWSRIIVWDELMDYTFFIHALLSWGFYVYK